MRYQAAPLPDAGGPLGGIAAGGKPTTKKGAAARRNRPSIVPAGQARRCDAYFLAGAAVFAASARIESAALSRLADALLTSAAAVLLVRSLA